MSLLSHEHAAFSRMLYLSRMPMSCCAVTGRTLFTLRKVGDQLSVDRIDSTLGYVAGNMRLLALSLNVAKGAGDRVPQEAINKLLWRLDRVKDAAKDKTTGVAIRPA